MKFRVIDTYIKQSEKNKLEGQWKDKYKIQPQPYKWKVFIPVEIKNSTNQNSTTFALYTIAELQKNWKNLLHTYKKQFLN